MVADHQCSGAQSRRVKSMCGEDGLRLGGKRPDSLTFHQTVIANKGFTREPAMAAFRPLSRSVMLCLQCNSVCISDQRNEWQSYQPITTSSVTTDQCCTRPGKPPIDKCPTHVCSSLAWLWCPTSCSWQSFAHPHSDDQVTLQTTMLISDRSLYIYDYLYLYVYMFYFL